MNDVKDKVYTYTYTYTFDKKDYITTIKVNKRQWQSFMAISKQLGFTANGLINRLIESFVSGKSGISKEHNSTNININLLQAQQTFLKQSKLVLTKKNYMIINQLRKMEKMKKGSPLYEALKDDLAKLATKTLMDPETEKKVREVLA